MEILIVWFILSVAVGTYAEKKGRSGVSWWLLAMVISPLIAFIFALIADDLRVDPSQPNPDTHLKCPDCRELVLKDARKCKHCGCALVPQS
jgi:hypothetical protein